MPYITQDKRKVLDIAIDDLWMKIKNPKVIGFETGVLNYVISSLVAYAVEDEPISYSNLSRISGVLHDVQVEYDRMVMAPYENKKRALNGDVYNEIY